MEIQSDRPNEAAEDKFIVISDTGRVSWLGLGPRGYWFETPNEHNDYEQGKAVTLAQMRAAVEAIRIALTAAGIELDEVNCFALAMLGLQSSGPWWNWNPDSFNANAFHRGVVELAPVVFGDENGFTYSYDAAGNRQPDEVKRDEAVTARRQKMEARRRQSQEAEVKRATS